MLKVTIAAVVALVAAIAHAETPRPMDGMRWILAPQEDKSPARFTAMLDQFVEKFADVPESDVAGLNILGSRIQVIGAFALADKADGNLRLTLIGMTGGPGVAMATIANDAAFDRALMLKTYDIVKANCRWTNFHRLAKAGHKSQVVFTLDDCRILAIMRKR